MLRRILARLRSRYPLSFIFPPLFAGHVLAGACAGPFSVAVICTLIIAAGFLLYRGHSVYLLCLCIVGTSALVLNGAVTIQAPFPEQRVIFKVIDRPGRPNPNDLRLRVEVIDIVRGQEDDNLSDSIVGKHLLCKATELPWRNISGVQEGDVFIGTVTIKPFQPSGEFFGFDRSMLRAGISAACTIRFVTSISKSQNHLTLIRQEIIRMFREGQGASLDTRLLLSILLGIRESIPNPVEMEFKVVGLSHLLVFSGAQVVMMYGVWYWLLSCLVLFFQKKFHYYHGSWAPSIGAMIVTTVFVLLIGTDKSSVRALLALVVGWFAAQIERGGGLTHAILAAGVLLSIVWPGCFFEPGVQLTFAALIGIAVGQRLGSSWWIYPCTSITTSVVSVLWFGQLSLLGFILNPLVVPLISGLVCTIGVLGVVLFSTRIDAEGVIVQALSVPLGFIEDIMYRLQFLPYAYITLGQISTWVTVLFLLSVLVLICTKTPKRA